MGRALLHRGPDGTGEFSAPHIALAMTRLSVIDVAGGWQPFRSEDGSLQLVINGEIYNHVELRQRLARGHRLRTRADGEVVLHLYEEHGIACVDHLRGMFAFALWDASKCRLLLARDRMGEKPLYVYETDGFLIFASELKALLASGVVPFEPDPVAIDRYFYYQYVPEPATALIGVRKLPPGHILTVDVHPWRVEEHRYWRMEDASPIQGNPVDVIRAGLEELAPLVIRSDVPVGIALSGGLDSSTVAVLAARFSKQPVHAFSVGYTGRPANDERDQAQELANSLGMQFHQVELGEEDVVRMFPMLVRDWDDPIADMTGFCYRSVARLAQQKGVRVLMQGQGGDELFWGYPWVKRAMEVSTLRTALWRKGFGAILEYLSAAYTERLDDGQRMNSRGRQWAVPAIGPLLHAWAHFCEDLGVPRGRLRFYDLHPDFREAERAADALYQPEFQARRRSDGPYAPFTLASSPDHLAVELTRLICGTYLLENGLTQGDRLSMAASVELRIPLVDHCLVEKTIGLRKTYDDHLLPPKAWLREAVTGLVPESTRARPKRPFSPPLAAWRRSLFEAYGWTLPDGVLVELGILRPQASRWLAENQFPEGAGSTLSFKALVLEAWCRVQLGEPVTSFVAAPNR
jgi:asparagine synthase (glutamine-hydrolysing)